MTSTRPLVSIVIPCHNQGHFLADSLESALSQSYPHVEVIVVDDGSQDATMQVAGRYPGVRCIRSARGGLGRARNVGLQAARGALIAFLDADDRLVRTGIEAGLASLAENPSGALAAGECRTIAEDGSPAPTPIRGPVAAQHPYVILLESNPIWMPAVALLRREVFDRVGVFDPTISPVADYDLYLRIAREYPICWHDEVVAEYRQHGGNMSRNAAAMLAMILKVHRAQRPYLGRDPQRHAAFRAGRHFWREFYGERLAGEIRASVRSGRWRRAAAGLYTLTRYAPRVAARHGWRKLRQSTSAAGPAREAPRRG